MQIEGTSGLKWIWNLVGQLLLCRKLVVWVRPRSRRLVVNTIGAKWSPWSAARRQLWPIFQLFRSENKIGYGDLNDPPGRMNYGDVWGRGLQQGRYREMHVGPSRDVYRDDMQFQWRERASPWDGNEDGVGGRGYGLQRSGRKNDDVLPDRQWTELRKSRSSSRENSRSGSVERRKTQTALFSSSEQ